MTKPITPTEVYKRKKKSLPNEVLEAFNELIAKNWNGSSATVSQTEVSKLIRLKLEKNDDFPNGGFVIFKNEFLDIEEIYEKAGWQVDYGKPGFNETWYEPTYTFTKR